MLVSLSCRGASYHVRWHWSQQLLNRPFHGAVHFRNHGGHIALIDVSNLRNSVTPNDRSSGDAGHLGGDSNLDFHAALIVEFLKLLQASAEHVVDIAASVVGLYVGKDSAGTQAFEDGVGDEITRGHRPAMVRIEAELFRGCLVDNCSLTQVVGRAEFTDRETRVRFLRSG